ncbi:MAG: RNA polymerase sigma factor, partial [Marinilabiliales bacterium]|nr:RNA polymerase sigma factor [Marinilabiliales bacterium]
IDAVLKGNPEAFAPLVDKYRQMAFSLCHKITGNREDAEEAAQDAFLKAYRSLEQFKRNASFRTWLFRIIYTTAISKVRGKNRVFVSFEDYRISDQEVEETESTLGLMNKDERAYQLQRAMDELDPDERALLNFYYFEDLSVEDIASITSMSASNVKVKLFRIRKRLYDRLHGLLSGEEVFAPQPMTVPI